MKSAIATILLAAAMAGAQQKPDAKPALEPQGIAFNAVALPPPSVVVGHGPDSPHWGTLLNCSETPEGKIDKCALAPNATIEQVMQTWIDSQKLQLDEQAEAERRLHEMVEQTFAAYQREIDNQKKIIALQAKEIAIYKSYTKAMVKTFSPTH